MVYKARGVLGGIGRRAKRSKIAILGTLFKCERAEEKQARETEKQPGK